MSWVWKDLREPSAQELRGETLEELRASLRRGINAAVARNICEGRVEEALADLGWLDGLTEKDLAAPKSKMDPSKFKKGSGVGGKFTLVDDDDAQLFFGKHRGKKLTEIYFEDGGYLVWLRDNDGMAEELRRRAGAIIKTPPSRRLKHEPDVSDEDIWKGIFGKTAEKAKAREFDAFAAAALPAVREALGK